MKLLSICIPTYNRNEELAELVRHFLVPALDTYPNLIEVVVCDNSDLDIAEINRKSLDTRIRYHKNDANMGFAGNLIRCAREANATYIWIISDDDPILWPGFAELMEKLPQANQEGIDCVMLPFQTTNCFGDTELSNQRTDWSVASEINVIDLLNVGKIPFILFSSAVIRLNKAILKGLEDKFFTNAYLQVIMYLEMLRINSRVCFLSNSTIDYQPEYRGRFPITSLALSMAEVRQYMYEKFGIAKNEEMDYRGWLLWLIHHRGGLYQIKDGDRDRWKLLSHLHYYLNFKNLLLALALIVPKVMFQPVYLCYWSYKDMCRHGKISFAEINARISTNKKFISEKLS